MVGNRLSRKGADGILRRCMSEAEVPDILTSCHDSACGGHFSGQLTGQNILRAGYFSPTLFKDSHAYVKREMSALHTKRLKDGNASPHILTIGPL